MTRPVRLQLSRRQGFDLQAHSRAVNVLPAVAVTRGKGRKWGNPYSVGLVACNCRSAGECSHNTFNRATAAEAVEAFRAIPRSPKQLDAIRRNLAGKNLACFCEPGAPCHADVLLELANGPVCEEIQ